MLQIPMILALRKPKTTVFTMFFAFGTKNHGIYSVFLPWAEQKHWYLRSFYVVVRYTFYIQKQ